MEKFESYHHHSLSQSNKNLTGSDLNERTEIEFKQENSTQLKGKMNNSQIDNFNESISNMSKKRKKRFEAYVQKKLKKERRNELLRVREQIYSSLLNNSNLR
ncbi:hypothetical protein BY996DRAFT_1597654 [Phakopsora pachyrhizi]|nr:hypothetical protein BY996DRAFT_1597654 [Phakopsora pachyrhizi]